MEEKKAAAAIAGFTGTEFIVQTVAMAGGTMEEHALRALESPRSRLGTR